jgi:hypothetical protein
MGKGRGQALTTGSDKTLLFILGSKSLGRISDTASEEEDGQEVPVPNPGEKRAGKEADGNEVTNDM